MDPSFPTLEVDLEPLVEPRRHRLVGREGGAAAQVQSHKLALTPGQGRVGIGEVFEPGKTRTSETI